MAPKRRDPVTSTATATRYERAHLGTGDQKLVKPMANPIIGNAQKVGFQLIYVPRPSQFADRQQPVNCKLVSPNNALVAVGLTLDAVLERVSCYEEEANASRFGFREDAQ